MGKDLKFRLINSPSSSCLNTPAHSTHTHTHKQVKYSNVLALNNMAKIMNIYSLIFIDKFKTKFDMLFCKQLNTCSRKEISHTQRKHSSLTSSGSWLLQG